MCGKRLRSRDYNGTLFRDGIVVLAQIYCQALGAGYIRRQRRAAAKTMQFFEARLAFDLEK